MHPYVFQTATYSLRWENVMIMVGIILGVWMAFRRSAYKGDKYQDMILDLCFWLIPAGLIGARAWELFFTWGDYAGHPIEMLYIWNGGMSIQGSVLGGLIAALVFAWRRQVRVWELLDILALPVLLGMAVGRIGCLTSGDAFGRPVAEVAWWPQWLALVYSPESPAGQIFPGTPLIPAEALEGLLDFAILAAMLWYRPRREVPGRTALTFAISYSVLRFLLEFLRADSLMIGGVKAAQLLSVAAVLVAGALLWRQYRLHAHTTTKAAG